ESSFANIDPHSSLLDQMMMFFEGHIAYHKADMAMSRAVLKELSFSSTPQRQEDIREVMDVTFARMREIIDRAIRSGKASKPLYAGSAAWSMFALYYHLLQGFLCGFLDENQFRKDL